jgi:hypothetical protein
LLSDDNESQSAFERRDDLRLELRRHLILQINTLTRLRASTCLLPDTINQMIEDTINGHDGLRAEALAEAIAPSLPTAEQLADTTATLFRQGASRRESESSTPVDDLSTQLTRVIQRNSRRLSASAEQSRSNSSRRRMFAPSVPLLIHRHLHCNA